MYTCMSNVFLKIYHIPSTICSTSPICILLISHHEAGTKTPICSLTWLGSDSSFVMGPTFFFTPTGYQRERNNQIKGSLWYRVVSILLEECAPIRRTQITLSEGFKERVTKNIKG